MKFPLTGETEGHLNFTNINVSSVNKGFKNLCIQYCLVLRKQNVLCILRTSVLKLSPNSSRMEIDVTNLSKENCSWNVVPNRIIGRAKCSLSLLVVNSFFSIKSNEVTVRKWSVTLILNTKELNFLSILERNVIEKGTGGICTTS